MTTTTEKDFNTRMCEFVKKERDVQIAIAQEINMAVITVYHWAAYHPERLFKNKAAVRVARKFMKRSPVKNNN